jgi:hypothetical protein
MIVISPRPFLIGVANLALSAPSQYFTRTIPSGAVWRLKYFLIGYPVTIAAGAQTTPDLSYRLFDADGRAFQVNPVLINQFTSPGGLPDLDATNPIDIDYPGGTNVKIEISGNVALAVPTLSITLFGIRGWERMGR